MEDPQMEDPNEAEDSTYSWDGQIQDSGSVRMKKEAFSGMEGFALQVAIREALPRTADGYTLQADPDGDDVVVSWWPNVPQGSMDEVDAEPIVEQ